MASRNEFFANNPQAKYVLESGISSMRALATAQKLNDKQQLSLSGLRTESVLSLLATKFPLDGAGKLIDLSYSDSESATILWRKELSVQAAKREGTAIIVFPVEVDRDAVQEEAKKMWEQATYFEQKQKKRQNYAKDKQVFLAEIAVFPAALSCFTNIKYHNTRDAIIWGMLTAVEVYYARKAIKKLR